MNNYILKINLKQFNELFLTIRNNSKKKKI